MRRLLYLLTIIFALGLTAQAQTKISALPSGTPIATDVIPFVADPAGTPATKKTTVTNLFSALTPSLVNSLNRNGTGTKFQLFTGSYATNDCAKFDVNGNIVTNGAACNAGTVTSVSLSVPGVLFSVSGSPVTSSGTFSFALLTQNANKVFAGPTTGADATPTFRLLVAADLPSHTHPFTDITGTATNSQLPSTLSSKTFDNSNSYTAKDGSFTLQNSTTVSKQAVFDLSNIGTSTTRTVNIPNANSTTVQADTGASNNFLTAISAQGVISKARPSTASLSDYTEASCTLSLNFGGGSTGLTYSTQVCKYTQVGDLVHVDAQLILSAKGSSTGAATLTGLPVASTSSTGRNMPVVVFVTGATYTGVSIGQISPTATTTISLYALSNGAATALDNTMFTNTTSINVSVVYKTN